MTILVPIMLRGWVFLAILLFAIVPPRRAVLAAFILGWLFLPQAGIPLSGLPDLDKITATSMGAMLGVLLFDAQRLRTFRFSWVDLPLLAWCLVSIPAALVNDLGIYDGLSGLMHDTFIWAIPYFIGRLYFSDLASLRELAIGIFLGGLIYVPLCLWEIRMSPQLHYMVYGFYPSFFGMAVRLGGYRPVVFMQHGLMVGMWMTSASIVGVWLWRSGSLRRAFGMPMWLAVAALVFTTIMCKSTGAIALLALGLVVLFVVGIVRLPVLPLIVLALAPLYMFARAGGFWSGQELVSISGQINDERADSLEGRIQNEDLLLAKEFQRPILGWGGWGRWRVYDEATGKDITISDGMWVIAMGEKGLSGLVALNLIVLLPLVLVMRRIPLRHWAHPAAAAPVSLAMLLVLFSIDNLFNAMLNPIYLIAAGAISAFYVASGRATVPVRAPANSKRPVPPMVGDAQPSMAQLSRAFGSSM